MSYRSGQKHIYIADEYHLIKLTGLSGENREPTSFNIRKTDISKKMKGLAVLLFLAYFLPYSPGTSAAAVPLSTVVPESSHIALKTAIETQLAELMLTEVNNINTSLVAIIDELGPCVEQIESQKNSCIACVKQKCDERVQALQCGVTVSSGGGGCSEFPPICTLKAATEKAAGAVVKETVKAGEAIGKGFETVGSELEKVGVKIGEGVVDAAGEVGKVAEQAGQAIGEGAKKAVEGVKNVAEDIGKEVAKIGNQIATGVEDIGKKVVGGVKEAGETVIDCVKNIIGCIGRRRRQAEPTCDQLSNDTSVCSYYQASCTECDHFGAPGSTPDVETLVRGVCGDATADNYAKLDCYQTRLIALNATFNSFSATQVQKGPVWMGAGFKDVETTYEVSNIVYVSTASSPVNVFVPDLGAAIIAQDIFDQLFPTAC